MTSLQLRRACAPLLAVVLACSGMAPVLAANLPDFSGTWVLNAKKGENLGMMSAVKETVKIVQTAEEMTLQSSAEFMGKTSGRTVTYDLGGKTVSNDGPMGGHADTVARWEGPKLVVTWTEPSAIPGKTVRKVETRELSADGSTMSVTTTRGTKPPMVMVYERQ